MQWWPLAGLAVGLVGCGYETCSFVDDASRQERVGDHRGVAFRLLADLPPGETAGGGYGGTLVNRSTDGDCYVAAYHFDQMPRREDIPPARAGGSPETVPGGGVLVAERWLPPTGQYVREVAIEGDESWVELSDDPYGDPHIDRYVVLAFCQQPDVDVALWVSADACTEGRRTPHGMPEVQWLW